MKRYKYIKQHNNYDELELGQIYPGYEHLDWIVIAIVNPTYYRKNCFEEVKE